MKKTAEVKKLEYELGRYKKAVSDRDRRISELLEEIEGYTQLQDISNAVVESLLARYAASGAITLNMEDIQSRVKSGKSGLEVSRAGDIVTVSVMERA